MTAPDAELLQPPITAAVRPTAPADRAREATWVRLAPFGLAGLAAVLYGWNLTVSGYANTYYAAAAQAAGQSLSAWFFGSLDAASFITIDKPPVSLWAMGLSVRVLGLSPFAVLLPEALAGIGSVLLLYLTVKRQLGPLAGVIAGAAFALTPVAVLMFRYNNPDAMLVLLLVASAWALVRGLEHGAIRWAVLAAVLVGFAFLTKYLQAYLVLPAFTLTWLVAAPGTIARRLLGLATAAITVLVTSLWWVALVELLPVDGRPFIGGSPTNSAVQLVLGYDGLGRIFGPDAGGAPGPGGPGPPGGPGGFGGAPGLLRMFNAEWGGEVSWLLPGAVIGLVAGLIAHGRARRTDRRRAAFVLWGTWAIVHVLVFSLMTGVAHPYYAVALAPAAAALFGGGIAELWRMRSAVPWARIGIAVTLVITAAWSWLLLERTPDFAPGLGVGAVVVAVAAAVLLLASGMRGGDRGAAIARAALVVGVASVLVGPLAYDVSTASKAIAGGDPASGPNEGRFGSVTGAAIGGFGGRGPGSFADGASEELLEYLVANRRGATWLVAVTGAGQAASIQLDSGIPVMAMGGFSGMDLAPTLDQLQAYVRDGELRYVLAGGPEGPGVTGAQTRWLTSTCTPVPLGTMEATLFDCAGAAD